MTASTGIPSGRSSRCLFLLADQSLVSLRVGTTMSEISSVASVLGPVGRRDRECQDHFAREIARDVTRRRRHAHRGHVYHRHGARGRDR